MSMPSLRCIFCGSTYHDYRHCTAVYKLTAQKQAIAGMKQEYAGQSPSIFVGHYGYPNVNVGILNVGQYEDHDDPLKWSREEVPITKIVELRSSLINAHTPKPVTAPRSFNDRLLEMSKEIALARKPADVEIALERKPQFKVAFYQDAAPHGPSVALKSASLAANPSTDERLQAAADDTDLRAGEALTTLFRRGVDEHALTKALSVGTLGLTPQRKLVPTRWAITAVDDTLGKKLIQEIKQYPESDCLAFAGGHLGNTYCILFFDDVWQYELFEQFVPQERRIPPEEIVPETDYEPYTGRTEYASETVGGYYAARIGILEKLRDLKRQSSVLAIRVITEEYTAPLGVWVVREAVRKALANPPLRFDDRDLMLAYAKSLLKKRFGYEIGPLLAKSRLLSALKNQKKLRGWRS